MLRAWKAQDSLLDEAAAKPWFLTIIRREYARSFERKRFVTVDVDELIAKEEPMLAAAQDQDLAELRAALFKLPEEYREPLVLQVLMGFSTAEIAAELNLSNAAVLTRLFRGRKQLRDDVRRRHQFGPRRMMDCVNIDERSWRIRTTRIRSCAMHRDSCRECREYTERLLRFEARLERALRVRAPAQALRAHACGEHGRVAAAGWPWPPACWLSSWWRGACGSRRRGRAWLQTSWLIWRESRSVGAHRRTRCRRRSWPGAARCAHAA